MRFDFRRTVLCAVGLAACLTWTGSARPDGFLSSDAKVSQTSGTKHAEQSASKATTFGIAANTTDFVVGTCAFPELGGTPGSSNVWGSAVANGQANWIHVGLFAAGDLLQAQGGKGGCTTPMPDVNAQASLDVTVSGAVFETIGYQAGGFAPLPSIPFPFAEVQIPGTASGQTQSLSKSFAVDFMPMSEFGSGISMSAYWSIGAPAGSASAPFGPTSFDQGQQQFNQPTPGDAAAEGGVRYQQPSVGPEMALGFDLVAFADSPFATFRFPTVPAGANDHFTLKVGDNEIAGLAGETVNLRQFAPGGVGALSLRGDLTPFISWSPAAGAIPTGGDQAASLTFGLAFSQPGVANFTLTPVPEPKSWVLALMAGALASLARRRGARR